jgi:hypothetical protein
MRGLWVSLLAFASCYRPTLHDCAITCETQCPNGLSCEDGFCRTGETSDSCGSVLDAQGDAPFSPPKQVQYVKATNPGTSFVFGFAVAVSVDGTTAAFGSELEASDTIGVMPSMNTNQPGAGALYIAERTSGVFGPQTFVKPSNTTNTTGNLAFGTAVAISADGSTIAVGAIGEASSASGVGGNEVDLTMPNAGAVYVFRRASGGKWNQEAYVKADNPDSADHFGISVALSGDGSTLAVGAPNEAGDGTSGEHDNSVQNAGAAYVYRRSGAVWSVHQYIKPNVVAPQYVFGSAVSLSADGNRLAVGSPGESSGSTGVDNDNTNASQAESGAVYIFEGGPTPMSWDQKAYVKPSNTRAGFRFGTTVALSGPGDTLAVGAPFEDGMSRGVGGDQGSGVANSGAVYVFHRTNTWQQQAYIKSSNADTGDQFGISLAVAPSGNLLVVGASSEQSTTMDPADNLGIENGAAYLFTGPPWLEQSYLKADNTGVQDLFGGSTAIANDDTILIGAPGERSDSANTPENDSDPSAGAVYVFQ